AVSIMGEIGDFSAFSKPKLVAMGAVSHKVCNMIFAILRDNKPFKIIAPQEHIKQYNAAKCDIAA
ncbi:MAG: IS110 family transposase, partial [Catonella sp.]